MDLGRIALQPVHRYRPVISPAGRRLAVAGAARVVIADLPDGSIRHEIPVSATTAIAEFDEWGGTLTVVGLDASVTVVDAASGDDQPYRPGGGCPRRFPPLRSHEPTRGAQPADRQVVAVAGTARISLYAARTGTRIGTVPRPSAVGVRTAFSPDARMVVVTRITSDNEIVAAPHPRTLWEQRSDARAAATFDRAGRLAMGRKVEGRGVVQIDAVAGGPLLEIGVEAVSGTPSVRKVDVTGAGIRLVVSASSDQAARLHSASSGELQYERPHPGALTDVAFLQGGRGFATACADGGVRLFDTVTGERRWLVTHAGPVNALAWVPGGELVCSASSDKTVRCLEAATGAERWRVTLPRAVPRMVASPDARFVVAACADRSARSLAIGDGAERWRVPHDGGITALAVSPDGATVATACEDGSVRVIASGTGSIIRTVGHVRPPTSVTFSEDGRTVISGSLDGAVLASSVTDPAATPVEMAHAATPVTRIVRNDGDGSMAVVAEDGVVRVLDLGLRAEVARLFHDARVHDIAVDVRNGLLVSGADDGIIRIWPWPSADQKRGMD